MKVSAVSSRRCYYHCAADDLGVTPLSLLDTCAERASRESASPAPAAFSHSTQVLNSYASVGIWRFYALERIPAPGRYIDSTIAEIDASADVV
jgi:hypothetical protein